MSTGRGPSISRQHEIWGLLDGVSVGFGHSSVNRDQIWDGLERGWVLEELAGLAVGRLASLGPSQSQVSRRTWTMAAPTGTIL